LRGVLSEEKGEKRISHKLAQTEGWKAPADRTRTTDGKKKEKLLGGVEGTELSTTEPILSKSGSDDQRVAPGKQKSATSADTRAWKKRGKIRKPKKKKKRDLNTTTDEARICFVIVWRGGKSHEEEKNTYNEL